MATEAEILAALNLGSSKAILENKGSSPLSELLVSLVEGVVNDLKEALVARNINTTSLGLSQSLGVSNISFNGDSVSVGITAEFYWKYINYGVNGTEVNHGAPEWGKSPAGVKSFKESISEWIPQRGVMLPQEFRTFDSFAFAIMNSIKKKGKAPKPFFEDVVNESLVAKLQEPISNVLGRAIIVNIVSPWQ